MDCYYHKEKSQVIEGMNANHSVVSRGKTFQPKIITLKIVKHKLT